MDSISPIASLGAAPRPVPAMIDAEVDRCVAVVGLGGTRILTLVVDGSLRVLAEDRRATSAELGSEAVVRNVIESIEAASAHAGCAAPLRAIGVAAAGTIDQAAGAADSVTCPIGEISP